MSVFLTMALVMTSPTVVDGRINLADFARVVQFTGDSPRSFEVHELERGLDGWDVWTGDDGEYMIGVEWDEPRDLAEVEIEFRHAIANREQIRVQYFQNHWPKVEKGCLVPPDDPFHGRWVTAKAEWWAGDRDVGFAFVPYNQEQPGDDAPAISYRRTSRLRFLLGKRDHELPPVRYLRAFGPSDPTDATFDIRFDPGSLLKLPIDISVLNGYLLEQNGVTTTQSSTLDSAPAKLRVRYEDGKPEATNRTIITFRNRDHALQGMSFLPAEATQYGIIRIPSLGVVVAHVGSQKDLQIDRRPGTSVPVRQASEYDRNFKRVMREITRCESTTQPGHVATLPSDLLVRTTVIEVPDSRLNDQYKKQIAYLLLADNPEKSSPKSSPDSSEGFEAMCRRIRALDHCGLHDSAERLLKRILDGQSRRLPQGRFTRKKGVFGALPNSDDGYKTGNSNLDHGFALVALNEHYRFTRDRRWLMNITDCLIEACDFVSHQRKTAEEAHTLGEDDLLWGKGLLPPGQVDDTPAWFWWFAVNAHAYRGMQMTAESLTEINDPDAGRIAQDASSFGKHLRRSCKEAMVRAPVVRLRNGTYVPQQPARSRCRGRDFGSPHNARWGPMHLVDCGVYEFDSPEAKWILSSSEHRTDPPAPGQDHLNNQSDGSAFVAWLRHLLVAEHNDRLDLLKGVPAAWLEEGKKITVYRAATWFGPLDLTVESTAEPRQIVVRLYGPVRNLPQATRLFVRMPEPIAAVTYNGQRLSTFEPSTGVVDLPRIDDSATIVITY